MIAPVLSAFSFYCRVALVLVRMFNVHFTLLQLLANIKTRRCHLGDVAVALAGAGTWDSRFYFGRTSVSTVAQSAFHLAAQDTLRETIDH